MNTGVEGMNGTTHSVGMGIDGLGGAVDGARGEVSGGTQSASKGCTCCGCAVLLSLNTERESCGVPMQTEGSMG